jgi:hypothetical protein
MTIAQATKTQVKYSQIRSASPRFRLAEEVQMVVRIFGLFAIIPVFLLLAFQQGAAQAVVQPLGLLPESASDARVALLSDGIYEITATGSHPSVNVALTKSVSADSVSFLAFEYFFANAGSPVQVEFTTSVGLSHTVKASSLSHSEGYTSYSTNLAESPYWKGNISSFRVRYDAKPGEVLRIRRIALRTPNADELALSNRMAEEHSEDVALETRLKDYLGKQFPEEIASVYVTGSTVRIEGKYDGDGTGLFVAEIPINEDITQLRRFDYVSAITPVNHHFRLEVTRFRTLPDGRYDRLLSKWALVRKTSTAFELASHARYADEVEPKWDLPDDRPLCKKGMGGASVDRPLEDLDQLGICSITVNVFLDFVHGTDEGGDIPFSWNGHTYFADAKRIGQYDRMMQYAAKRHIIVSAILLIPQARQFTDPVIGKLMAHPDADPSGHFAMPNMNSAEGVQTYAATLNFLAERYSRPDMQYGRIHNWIMHNEVDAGWVWTNAGEKSEVTYMDLYTRSMRTMYLIARQYNPHSKVFISLTHYWNWTADPHFYLPRLMLDELVKCSKVEGDFEWAIAYHPYPQSLLNSRTWEDHQVTYSLDTPLITFKNIEVLNAWAEQPSHFYRGIKIRTIYLSEQGFNSPDYSPTSLNDQAAALAYAWKKIEPLDAIEAMQYHNWVDNAAEGGLRIGLRKLPGDPFDPLGKKPIWYLYQQLETPEEDNASAFALPVIGIKSWTEVPYRGAIQDLESLGPAMRNLRSDSWIATDALGRKLPGYTEVGPPKPGRYVAMFYFLTHGSPGEPGPRDVTKSLAANSDTSHWQPGTYYWGEPEFGYYLSNDEWVIRHHAEMLSDAGVDVIVFDTTNDKTFPEIYKTIAKVYNQMRSEGERTPQIAFLASHKSIDQLWTDLYSKGLYKDLWFQWKGRPLLLTGQHSDMKRADELPQYIQNFFSIRQSWAWDSLPWYRDGYDQWPWVAHFPQIYGWHDSPVLPEAVPVAVAEHPLSDIGRSFHDGHEPATNQYDVTAQTPLGLFFQEQWNRAIALDPEIVFVTGWNEWSAGSKRAGNNISDEMASWDFYPGAQLSRAGHPIHPGDIYFIDQYNEEFSRDIEPMTAGYGDDYYYQLVANIRRYKGVHAPEPASLPQTIALEKSFDQWSGVTPEYLDHVNDTVHRNSPGNYQAGAYVDNTGRNDIISTKVTRDAKAVYFYARTREPLTSPRGKNWMLLYIDSDQDSKTGWLGYDYVVNAHVLNDKTTTLCPISRDGVLGVPSKVKFRAVGSELMIAIPRGLIGQADHNVHFDFHWTDNVAPGKDPADFLIRGDSAPDRRFNYRYDVNDLAPAKPLS